MIRRAMDGNWTLLAAALTGVASVLIARECLARVVEYEDLLRSTTEAKERSQLARDDIMEMEGWED